MSMPENWWVCLCFPRCPRSPEQANMLALPNAIRVKWKSMSKSGMLSAPTLATQKFRAYPFSRPYKSLAFKQDHNRSMSCKAYTPNRKIEKPHSWRASKLCPPQSCLNLSLTLCMSCAAASAEHTCHDLTFVRTKGGDDNVDGSAKAVWGMNTQVFGLQDISLKISRRVTMRHNDFLKN